MPTREEINTIHNLYNEFIGSLNIEDLLQRSDENATLANEESEALLNALGNEEPEITEVPRDTPELSFPTWYNVVHSNTASIRASIPNVPKSRKKSKSDEQAEAKSSSNSSSKYYIEWGPNILNIIKYTSGRIADIVYHTQHNKNEWPILSIEVIDEDLVEYVEAKTNKKQQARVGRVIGKLLDFLKIRNDSDIEQFVNCYRAFIMVDKGILNLEFYKGADIAKYYLESNQINRNSLGNSCMRYAECGEYLKFYDNEKVSLAALTNSSNKVIARALIWDLGNIKLMDRIYSSEDWQVHIFKKWAGNNNVFCKYYQGQKEKNIIQLKDKVYTFNLSITIDQKFEKFPYLDTFTYTKDLKTFKTWEEPGDFKMSSTRGDWRIKVGNDWYDKSELVWSEYNNKFIFRNDGIEIPELGWVYHNDVVYINNNPYIKDTCWCDANGVWRNDPINFEDILAGTVKDFENESKQFKKIKTPSWARQTEMMPDPEDEVLMNTDDVDLHF